MIALLTTSMGFHLCSTFSLGVCSPPWSKRGCKKRKVLSRGLVLLLCSFDFVGFFPRHSCFLPHSLTWTSKGSTLSYETIHVSCSFQVYAQSFGKLNGCRLGRSCKLLVISLDYLCEGLSHLYIGLIYKVEHYLAIFSLYHHLSIPLTSVRWGLMLLLPTSRTTWRCTIF